MPPRKLQKKYGHKVWILGNRCHRCKHEWRPRELEEVSKVCLSCKSPYWDVPRKEKK